MMAAVIPVWWAVLVPAQSAGPDAHRADLVPAESGVADVFRAIRYVETGLRENPGAVSGTLSHGRTSFLCTRGEGGALIWEQAHGPGFCGRVQAWRD
jgi:hypothetical protein